MQSKLNILKGKKFILIDSNKIIMMKEDKIEFVNFIEGQPISVKDYT
jgi:hypothetical protein